MLFRGQYAFRTLNGVMTIVVALVASAVFVAVAIPSLRLVREVSLAFALGALAFGGIGLRALWGWIHNERIPVEINEDGIIRGIRFWPWDRVHALGGTHFTNGVRLGFVPRGRIVWGVGGDLPTTPLLTEAQYVELAREVSGCISARFPHVTVAMQPVVPS